jgi:hypothetical protein
VGEGWDVWKHFKCFSTTSSLLENTKLSRRKIQYKLWNVSKFYSYLNWFKKIIAINLFNWILMKKFSKIIIIWNRLVILFHFGIQKKSLLIAFNVFRLRQSIAKIIQSKFKTADGGMDREFVNWSKLINSTDIHLYLHSLMVTKQKIYCFVFTSIFSISCREIIETINSVSWLTSWTSDIENLIIISSEFVVHILQMFAITKKFWLAIMIKSH